MLKSTTFKAHCPPPEVVSVLACVRPRAILRCACWYWVRKLTCGLVRVYSSSEIVDMQWNAALDDFSFDLECSDDDQRATDCPLAHGPASADEIVHHDAPDARRDSFVCPVATAPEFVQR